MTNNQAGVKAHAKRDPGRLSTGIFSEQQGFLFCVNRLSLSVLAVALIASVIAVVIAVTAISIAAATAWQTGHICESPSYASRKHQPGSVRPADHCQLDLYSSR